MNRLGPIHRETKRRVPAPPAWDFDYEHDYEHDARRLTDSPLTDSPIHRQTLRSASAKLWKYGTSGKMLAKMAGAMASVASASRQ